MKPLARNRKFFPLWIMILCPPGPWSNVVK